MRKIKTLFILSFLAIVTLTTACSEKPIEATVSDDVLTAPSKSTSTEPSSPTTNALGNTFNPKPFPSNTILGIPGFQFPEAAITIDNWVAANPMNTDSIYLHGWGIWAGLNYETTEMFEGQLLRVFETWYTPQDILCITGIDTSDCPIGQALRKPNPVGVLNQNLKLNHRGVGDVVGFVKYDPTAANHIIEQQLLNKMVLTEMLKDGENSIPAFPNTAISIKPVFAGTAAATPNGPIISTDGTSALLAIYPGSQLSCDDPATGKCFPKNPNHKGYGPMEWPKCVWIDTTNSSSAALSAPVPCSSNSSTTAYNISEFVHFQDTAGGEYSVLVGMHTTTREIHRWAWQSFFWTPTPDNPPDPSSKDIANARPKQIVGAAANYAMAIGYSMVSPAQPVTGGKAQGESIYAFNPYLEAGFPTLKLAVTGSYTYEGVVVPNRVGVESNCMSCHALATLSGKNDYTGDQYIDLQDPAYFENELSLDFLWSIEQHATNN